MPTFVKAHRRGRSLVKAYTRNARVGLVKQKRGLSARSNYQRQDRILADLATKIGRGNRMLRRPTASSYLRVSGRLGARFF